VTTRRRAAASHARFPTSSFGTKEAFFDNGQGRKGSVAAAKLADAGVIPARRSQARWAGMTKEVKAHWHPYHLEVPLRDCADSRRS